MTREKFINEWSKESEAFKADLDTLLRKTAAKQRGACWLTLMEKACDISDESLDAISVLNTPLVTAKTPTEAKKYDCDDCVYYPCIGQKEETQEKLKRGTCGDYVPK